MISSLLLKCYYGWLPCTRNKQTTAGPKYSSKSSYHDHINLVLSQLKII